jgi:hypothetical protein
MKKIYLSALAATILTSATAQRINHQTFAPAGKHTIINEAPTKTSVNQLKGLLLWSDDFSTAANWSFNNSSTPAHGWTISTNPSATNLVAPLSPFGAATAANGFAFINSDAAGQGSTTNADIKWAGTPVDLTGYENVTLKFSNATRNWSSTYKVIVSTNGTTWTEFQVNQHITTNINTANPETVVLNISSVAGNQPTVWIGFRFEASWGWFWAIDDVEIVETDDFDVKLANINWGTEGAWGDRLSYHQIPTAQVAPIFFGATAENIGRFSQNAVSFNVGGALTSSGAFPAIEPGTSQYTDAISSFTPAATVGAHSFNFSISAINTIIALTEGGNGYTTSTDVAVTGGTGSGMLVDIFANTLGEVTALDDNTLVGGTNYESATDVDATGGSGSGLTVDIIAEQIGVGTSGTLSAGGSGYETAMGVATATTGAGAGLILDITAEVIGMVENTSIHASGSGYADATDVAVIDGASSGSGLTLDITAEPIGAATSLLVVAQGTGYADGVTSANGGAGNGLMLAIIADALSFGEVLSANIVDGGSGYDLNDIIQIVGGDGTAFIEITGVTNGEVTSVAVNQAGMDYEVGDLVTIDAGDGNAVVEITAVSEGEVLSATIADGGMDYSVGDVVTIDGGNSDATFTVDAVTLGMITSITINNPGINYVVGDVVTINAGDANATIEIAATTMGDVVAVTLVNEGIGYTDEDVVTIDGGNGAEITISIGDFDSDMANNTLPALTINTTQHLYSRTNSTSTAGSFNAGEGFEVGPIFDVFANATLYAVKVYVGANTNPGAQVFASVYRIDPNSGDFLFERTSNPITTTASTIDGYINIPLLSPVDLVAGEPILVVAGSLGDGGATNDLVVGTSGPAPTQTVFYLDYTDQQWYYTTSTPMITLDFNQVSSVQESVTNMTLGQNMPNPFSNSSIINYTLTSTEDITFEIVDMTGKLVKVIREGVRTAGSYAITIEANELSEGVYFYSMTNGTSKITKSMVVTK